MIEDELRTLLRSRVAAPPDNPARTAQVRSRITTTNRRRAVGGALALVLVALAGLAVLRLPGTNESLPPGVPAPPYFDGDRPAVPGYVEAGNDLRPEGFAVFVGDEHYRFLFVLRCARPESVTVRNAGGGDPVAVPCRIRVGDHFEGAAPVTADRSRTLFALNDRVNVRVERSAAGQPDLHLLRARLPDRLTESAGDGYLLDGARTPAGATVDLVPARPQSDEPPAGPAGFTLQVECVAGVRLTFTVPAGTLGTVTCDPFAEPADPVAVGVPLRVSAGDMRRLGLDYGRPVRLTVVRTGTETGQWRVSAIG